MVRDSRLIIGCGFVYHCLCWLVYRGHRLAGQAGQMAAAELAVAGTAGRLAVAELAVAAGSLFRKS